MARTGVNPKGDRYYDRRALNYDKRRMKQQWWHVEQREMKSLLEGLPRGLKVVDVPFGTGRFVPYYAELGYEIYGLDASDHMIDAARRPLGELFNACTTAVGDAADLPFEDGAFDLLVSTRFLRDIVTFEHARRVIAEFARVTARYAIIQLGHTLGAHRAPREDEVMGSLMSKDAVDALLTQHGLQPVQRREVKADGESRIDHVLCERQRA